MFIFLQKYKCCGIKKSIVFDLYTEKSIYGYSKSFNFIKFENIIFSSKNSSVSYRTINMQVNIF